MKRRKFLQAAMATTPLTITDLQSKSIRNTKGFKVNAGEGRFHGHITMKGRTLNSLDLKVSGKDSDSGLAIFESTTTRGVPLHVHFFQDEIFFVLEGEYQFQIGEERYDMKPGDTIFLPRNIPHAFVPKTELGRMIVVLQPAGKAEEFFLKMSSLPEDSTAEERARITEDYGMKVMGPPIKLE